MKKISCNAKLYKIRLVKIDEPLFWSPNYVNNWDVPCKAIIDDYNEDKPFQFVHPKIEGKTYSRHYQHPVRNGYAWLRVGEFKTTDDYAEVIININSISHDPYVVLIDSAEYFNSHNELADIVTRAFNWALASHNLGLEMEPWNPSEDEKVFWIKDCHETYRVCDVVCDESGLLDFGFEQLKRIGGKRKSDDFIKYIAKGSEEKVLSWLHSMIDGTRDVANFMLPMRAVAELQLFIRRPPLEVFYEEFNKKGLVKKTAYHEYLNWSNDKCDKDGAYKEILRQAKEFFGIS